MAIEILLVWIAFIIGVYQQHLQDVLQSFRRTPKQWRWIVKGMWKSKTFFAIAIMIAMSFGILLINIRQEKVANENTERIIDEVIKKTENQRNQEINNLIDRIDKLIEAMEASNATNK